MWIEYSKIKINHSKKNLYGDACIHLFHRATFALFSDSTSKLPLIISGDNNQAIREQFDITPLPSLNGSKIRLIALQGLETREHYKLYLQTRMKPLWNRFHNSPQTVFHMLELMHMYSGGKIRDLRSFNYTQPRVRRTDAAFPLNDSPLYYIFVRLASLASSCGVDCFNLPTASENQIFQWLESVLITLTFSNVLIFISLFAYSKWFYFYDSLSLSLCIQQMI